ncbi:MAG: hypothetical protein KAG61_05510 [Bacteriovoracaceae bacterium]|nr:hypothetical protein [Bacteriovoracaceae bacterium]
MKKILITLLTIISLPLIAGEDITFKMIDNELGVTFDDYPITSDRQRVSLVASHGTNLKSPGNMYSIELNYALRLDSIWVETFISQTTANFNSLFGSQDNTVDDAGIGDTTEKMISGGIGLGHRFNYIQELLGSSKWYESTTAFATYNLMEETYTAKPFQGFGLRTDFGIHYRMNPSSQVGLKGIYHVASLVRGPQNDTEKRTDRSLTTASLSFAFEYGMYF